MEKNLKDIPDEEFAKAIKTHTNLKEAKRLINNIRVKLWDGKEIEAHELGVKLQELIEEQMIPDLTEFINFLVHNHYWIDEKSKLKLES